MYGTVMIAKLGGTRDELEAALGDWLARRATAVRGFVDAGLMIADDGETVVNWARFGSREDYLLLADDPAQAEWYRTRMAPLLVGEPRWIDGDWLLAGDSVRA